MGSYENCIDTKSLDKIWGGRAKNITNHVTTSCTLNLVMQVIVGGVCGWSLLAFLVAEVCSELLYYVCICVALHVHSDPNSDLVHSG